MSFWSKKSKYAVFGASLTEVIEKQFSRGDAYPVPNLFVNAWKYFDKTGLTVEQLFAISADPKNVEKLKEKVEKVEHFSFVDQKDLGPHLVTTLLKAYLKALPEPLITYEFYDSFVHAMTSGQPLQTLQNIINSLPGPNQALLRFFVALLACVAANQSQTKMGSSQLSMQTGSLITRAPPSDSRQQLELSNATPIAAAVQLLIEQYGTIFREMPRAALARLSTLSKSAPTTSSPVPSTPVYGGQQQLQQQHQLYSSSGAMTPGYNSLPLSPFSQQAWSQSAPSQQHAGGLYSSTSATTPAWQPQHQMPMQSQTLYGGVGGGSSPVPWGSSAQQGFAIQTSLPGSNPVPQQPRFIPVVPTSQPPQPTYPTATPDQQPVYSAMQQQFSMFDAGTSDARGSLIPIPGRQHLPSHLSATTGSAAVRATDSPLLGDGASQRGLSGVATPLMQHSPNPQGGNVSPGGDEVDIEETMRQDAQASIPQPVENPEQQYREKWLVLKAQEELRKEMKEKERVWEKEKKQLQAQITELRTAWAADRVSHHHHHQQPSLPAVQPTVHVDRDLTGKTQALQSELDSLRMRMHAVQQENEQLKQQRQLLQSLGELKLSGNETTDTIMRDLKRADEINVEIAKILYTASVAQSSQQQQQQQPQQDTYTSHPQHEHRQQPQVPQSVVTGNGVGDHVASRINPLVQQKLTATRPRLQVAGQPMYK